jgi:hypothetical protein
MTIMTALGLAMEEVAERIKYQGQFPLSQATEKRADESYMVTPEKDGLKAGPQVTTGLDLAKIRELAELNRKYVGLNRKHRAPKELEKTLGWLQGDARRVGRLRMGGKRISPATQGLVAILVNYIEAGANKNRDVKLPLDLAHAGALNYPKRIADLLLARTDMAKMFELLPEANFFAQRPHVFENLVLSSLNPDLKIGLEDPLFARGIQNDENDPMKGITIPELTIGDWIYGITHGFDMLSTVKDTESMGELGGRTEKIGPRRGYGTFTADRMEAGIFEFRGAQREKLPLLRWKEFALEFQAYITRVHSE